MYCAESEIIGRIWFTYYDPDPTLNFQESVFQKIKQIMPVCEHFFVQIVKIFYEG